MNIRFLGSAGLGSAVMALSLGLVAGAARADESRPEGSVPKAADRLVAGSNDAWMVYDKPSMRYEQPRFIGDARLFVREASVSNGSGPDVVSTPEGQRWRVYRGRDIDVITRANSNLATSSEMTGLRQYLATSTRTAPSAMRVSGLVRTSVEAPGLIYEPGVQTPARLFVRDAEGRETMYTGTDLASIVRTNPSLEQTNGFTAFRSRVVLVDSARPWSLRNDSTTIVNVSHTPTGVVVGTNEWRDGQWQSHTHQGATLDEIYSGQPTVRAMLNTDINTDLNTDNGSPQSASRPSWQVAPFGVTMATPPSCLNSQLKLEGRGVLVTNVTPGSSAYTYGLRNDDVIVDYDGRAVTDGEWVRSQFASWRTDSQPKIIVLRQGSRVTLSR